MYVQLQTYVFVSHVSAARKHGRYLLSTDIADSGAVYDPDVANRQRSPVHENQRETSRPSLDLQTDRLADVADRGELHGAGGGEADNASPSHHQSE